MLNSDDEGTVENPKKPANGATESASKKDQLHQNSSVSPDGRTVTAKNEKLIHEAKSAKSGRKQ